MSIAKNKVPFGQKVAFGLGMLANQMFPAVLGIFMVVLVQDLGFPGWMWSAIYFFPRIFDSITDPIMGFISDNTKSKWGRRRQYVFIGAVIMGVAFVTMWQLHREDGVDYNFMYFMIWSFIFYLGLTIFSVPYVAMGYEMSNDFHERTNIMATAQWIGQWAWIIAPWFWVIMYDPEWFPNADTATRTLAVWVGVACALLAMVPAIFIKSKSTKNDNSLEPLTIRNIGGSLKEIFKGFKEAFQSVPFRKLCISTFFIFNAFNTVAAFSFFIVVYHLFNGNTEASGIWPTLFGSIGALITTFLVIPIVAKMSKLLGKKRAFLWSQGISIIGYILLWFLFIPGKPYMFIFALPFFSFGIGSLFTLMMSMTADVCDLDELNTGKRREGIFGAIYWWMVKFGFAIAGGLSGLIISYVGLNPDAVVQPDGAVTGLRLFFSGVPIIGTLIAIGIMWNYDLTEERANEISAELERRKAKLKKSSSAYGAGNLLPLLSDKIKLKDYQGIDLSHDTLSTLKHRFNEKLEGKIHGLCFSPYLEGQNPSDRLSAAQIRRRMGIISPHTKWIRSFSCTDGNELIPEIAHEMGLKTIVGAWIDDDERQNEIEIKRLIELSRAGLVDIAAVGNEALLRGEVTEDQLIAYIKRIKKSLAPHNIPVGYVDTYYEFFKHPKVVEVSDIILTNCYPFWEGSSSEEALQHLREMHAISLHVAKGKKVIITETGWPSSGETHLKAVPSEENAMKYFIQTQDWAHKENVEIFHFSSFDETWKIRDEGEVGARWGIWNKNENLKYK